MGKHNCNSNINNFIILIWIKYYLKGKELSEDDTIMNQITIANLQILVIKKVMREN
jgi:hypothetical protein